MTTFRPGDPVQCLNRSRFSTVVHRLIAVAPGKPYGYRFTCGYATTEVEPGQMGGDFRACAGCWR